MCVCSATGSELSPEAQQSGNNPLPPHAAKPQIILCAPQARVAQRMECPTILEWSPLCGAQALMEQDGLQQRAKTAQRPFPPKRLWDMPLPASAESQSPSAMTLTVRAFSPKNG